MLQDVWLTRKKGPPRYMSYGSSASKGEHINRREHPKLRTAVAPTPWGGGVAEP